MYLFLGIKPYKCLFCQKTFSRRAHMLEHQQSHTDNYRFRCAACNKGFTRQSYYRDHKCPTGGNGTGGDGGVAEADGDGVAGEAEDAEDGGSRSLFARKSERPRPEEDETEEDDSSEGGHHGGEGRRREEGEQRRTDEVTEEQTDREEEDEEESDRGEEGGEALARTGDQNGLQQPCL